MHALADCVPVRRAIKDLRLYAISFYLSVSCLCAGHSILATFRVCYTHVVFLIFECAVLITSCKLRLTAWDVGSSKYLESYCRSISFFFWLSLLFLLFFYVFSHQSLSWWYSSDPAWKVQNSVLMKTMVDTCVRGGRKNYWRRRKYIGGKKIGTAEKYFGCGKKIGLRKKLGCGKNWAAEKIGLRKFFWPPMPSQNPGYNTVAARILMICSMCCFPTYLQVRLGCFPLPRRRTVISYGATKLGLKEADLAETFLEA